MKSKAFFSTGIFIPALFTGILFTQCETEPKEIDLENNPELREEVFEQILNNREVYKAFVMEMRENTTAMDWTMEDPGFTREMFRKENLQKIRKHNQEMDNQMMDDMITRMEEDTSVAQEMNRRMQERRLFHEDDAMMKHEE
ncbi:MAG: hypothetical protein ACOCVA_02750 [Prolixibacteraceae bacterium]